MNQKKKLTLACLVKRQISLRKKNIPIHISILKIDTTITVDQKVME